LPLRQTAQLARIAAIGFRADGGNFLRRVFLVVHHDHHQVGRTQQADRFMASIMLNRDTTDTWELSIGETDVTDRQGDSVEGEATHAATLTSGERLIVLTPVFSEKFNKRPSFASQLTMSIHPPAMGYEFVENGRSLCAVEYFSSGLAGSAKNTVWMDRNADPRLRLVLAAAMAAVLQLQSVAAAAPAEPE